MPFFSRPIYCIVPYSIPTYFTHVWQPSTSHRSRAHQVGPFCACAICGVRGNSSIALTREPLVHVHVQGWEKRCASAVPCWCRGRSPNTRRNSTRDRRTTDEAKKTRCCGKRLSSDTTTRIASRYSPTFVHRASIKPCMASEYLCFDLGSARPLV